MGPVTYGYTRASRSDDEARNLDSQLSPLVANTVRPDLIISDLGSGHTIRRSGWQELISLLRPAISCRWPSWTG